MCANTDHTGIPRECLVAFSTLPPVNTPCWHLMSTPLPRLISACISRAHGKLVGYQHTWESVMAGCTVHRGEGSGVNLVDLAILVLRYKVAEGSSLFPVSCELASGSQIQSIVTCSSFLATGCYVILPLAFNHWDLTFRKARSSSSGNSTEDSKPYVVALHSSKKVQYQENAQTRPGFLAESIFLLASRARAKSTVSHFLCRQCSTQAGRRNVIKPQACFDLQNHH